VFLRIRRSIRLIDQLSAFKRRRGMHGANDLLKDDIVRIDLAEEIS